jgi:hypothetical protein
MKISEAAPTKAMRTMLVAVYRGAPAPPGNVRAGLMRRGLLQNFEGASPGAITSAGAALARKIIEEER